MTKSDLRTGMRVTNESGKKFIVFLNCQQGYNNIKDFLVNGKATSWYSLSYFNDDLTTQYSCDDIVRVEIPNHPYSLFNIDSNEYATIWERKEPKPEPKPYLGKYTEKEWKSILAEIRSYSEYPEESKKPDTIPVFWDGGKYRDFEKGDRVKVVNRKPYEGYGLRDYGTVYQTMHDTVVIMFDGVTINMLRKDIQFLGR